MSEWVQTHLPCPCGSSSDAYSINDEGWGKCFSCGKNFKEDEEGSSFDCKIAARSTKIELGDSYGGESATSARFTIRADAAFYDSRRPHSEILLEGPTSFEPSA